MGTVHRLLIVRRNYAVSADVSTSVDTNLIAITVLKYKASVGATLHSEIHVVIRIRLVCLTTITTSA